MIRRLIPALLGLAALVADLEGAHGAARAVLLAAIPAAFLLAVECYGDALEGRCGAFRPFVAGLSLVLLVLSAALRSPAVVGGVPQLAVSALVLGLLLYATIAVEALLPAAKPQPAGAHG